MLTTSKRKYPSGLPKKKHSIFLSKVDNSWFNEWVYFKKLILDKDFSNNNEGLINMNFLNNCLTKSDYI